MIVPRTTFVTPVDRLDVLASPNSGPQWIAALEAHGVPDAAAIVGWYIEEGKRLRINHDLAIAQAIHETGWFSSRRWQDENNPAGLGITDPDTVSPGFDSPRAGITAHLEHLDCYAYTQYDCPADHQHLEDTRHSFHDGKPLLKDLIRPNVRSWAVPGDGYIDSIVKIANQVLGGPMPTPVPTSDDIGFPVRVHWAADQGPARSMQDIHWFVVHDTEGNLPGSEETLTSGSPPVASVHALIDRDGELIYSVPITTTAWTAGNDAVSRQSVEVELIGFGSGQFTDEQYRSMAKFYQWCTSQGMNVPAVYIGKQSADGGPLPDYNGIIGHMDVPDGSGGWGGVSHHTDPGPNFDFNKFIAYIGGATPNPPVPQPAPDAGAEPSFYQDGNPYGQVPIKGKFWARYNFLEQTQPGLGLATYGYAKKSEEFHGRWMQLFERAAMATGDGQDPWDVVTLAPSEWPKGW